MTAAESIMLIHICILHLYFRTDLFKYTIGLSASLSEETGLIEDKAPESTKNQNNAFFLTRTSHQSEVLVGSRLHNVIKIILVVSSVALISLFIL